MPSRPVRQGLSEKQNRNEACRWLSLSSRLSVPVLGSIPMITEEASAVSSLVWNTKLDSGEFENIRVCRSGEGLVGDCFA